MHTAIKTNEEMKKMTMLLLCCLSAFAAWANDGVFYVNGNQLVPLHETDISIAKETLTISICDDGFARVDVDYEFMNHGKAKEVDMGFEANAPYNDGDAMNKECRHPHIHDFTVTMNGEELSYHNAIVASSVEGESFQELDMKEWKVSDDLQCELKMEGTDSTVMYAFAYLFKAPFKEGLNRVKHTYRYRMSNGVGRAFEIPYWLQPAMRWANHRIDDFTLRIQAKNTAKHFCLENELFEGTPFKVTEGTGKVRTVKRFDDNEVVEVSLRNGTVEWHGKNFIPSQDITIQAAEILYYTSDTPKLGSFYDRGEYFSFWFLDNKDINPRIMRNLPYANRGYVFKSKDLQKYFSQFWWYMPDKNWQLSTDDFTPSELEYIKTK